MLADPQVAGNTIRFGGAKGPPRLSYDVELPCAYTFERIVPIDLSDLDDIWTRAAKNAGRGLADVAGVSVDEVGNISIVDYAKLSSYLRNLIAGLPSWRPPKPEPDPTPLPHPPPFSPVRLNVRTPDRLTHSRSRRLGSVSGFETLDVEVSDGVTAYTGVDLETALLDLTSTSVDQSLPLPVPSLGTAIAIEPFLVPKKTTPSLWLIERYTVFAYLHDFGVGRVVNCTTLLPGEELFLSIESWREDESSLTNASSIFDSFQQAAQDRFANAMDSQFTQETTSTAAGLYKFSKKEHEGGGFLGFYEKGHNLITEGESGYRNSASAFSNTVSSALSEHAYQSNAARETAVATSTVSREAGGVRTLSERRIRNTNLRRTLSFVFRELNQRYTAYTSLTGIDVAFGNGQPGSFERRPLIELSRLMQEYVVAGRVQDVLTRILNIGLLYVDAANTYTSPLQLASRTEHPPKWADPTIKDGIVDLDDGAASDLLVRFKPGSLKGGSADAPAVPGLIVSESSVVLRTDSILGEALLGQADALDPYALSLQEEDIRSRSLNNRKLEIALETIEGIENPKDKAAAYEQMLEEPSRIKIQSAILDSNGGAD